MRRPLLVVLLGLAAPATAPVAAVVFYDENGNGALDAGERVRIPGVVVEVSGRTGLTEAVTGRAVIEGVPVGTQRIRLRAGSLPRFFATGATLAIRVPQTGERALPVTLPIGSNRPNTYMAFGDSITDGDGSSDQRGYRGRLEAKLRAHFGQAEVINEGASATISHQGARRIAEALGRHRPACTLILYGTNDWDDAGADPAVTGNSLRRIVRLVKAASSLPFLATIPPTNVGGDPRASMERNRWVAATNQRIRAVARGEGAVLVDVHAALWNAGDPGRLFSDGLHPSDAGYERIASAFFEAIAHPTLP